MPYVYQNEKNYSPDYMRSLSYSSDSGMADVVYKAMVESAGKWVRYDENGKMIKGWVTIQGALASLYPDQVGNTYYYDSKTGIMAKGWVTIGGQSYFFDEVTGALR